MFFKYSKKKLRDTLIVYFYSKTKCSREEKTYVLKPVKHIYIYIYNKHWKSVLFVDIERPNVSNFYADIYKLSGLMANKNTYC